MASRDRISPHVAETKTQLTQPKKGEPVEIPVPKRKDVTAALKRLMRPAAKDNRGRR